MRETWQMEGVPLFHAAAAAAAAAEDLGKEITPALYNAMSPNSVVIINLLVQVPRHF